MSPETTQVPQSVGNYDLLSKIAEGGMGAVYRGRSRATGEIVAIKIIPPDTARNPVLLRRFEQEFKAASLIDHPNVVKAVDYCGTGATPFLVMEFVDGESLGQRVERDGQLPEQEAVRLMGQVCEGLHRAHKQGLIHRDVKPDNILVTRDGIAKLTDLGLVKDVEGELNLTRTGRGLGTPHFMAPEQFRNAKNADVRCDVYSLGATLYTMVTGIVPFNKTSPLDCWIKKTKNDFPEPRSLHPAISERVNWAICRAMDQNPAKRPASCREFMEDLTGSGWKSGSGMVQHPPETQISGLAVTEDLWYMVYRDEAGQARTVKGTTDSIRKNVGAGALGDLSAILVGRTKTGQFLPLKAVPEFRDLVVGPPQSGAFPAVEPAAPDLKETHVGTRTSRLQPPPSEPPSPAAAASSGRFGGLSPASGVHSQQSRTVPASGARPVDPYGPTEQHQVTPPIVPNDSGRTAHASRREPEPVRGNSNWLPWALLILLSIAVAVAGFFLLQQRQ